MKEPSIMKKRTFSYIGTFIITAASMCLPEELLASNETAKSPQPIPAYIFGQNIEHTRSAVQGGLSAQLMRNRKFAGKPDRRGVAMMWDGYGDQAMYDHSSFSCARHAAKSRMRRINERHCQVICGLTDKGEAGIRQDKIGIRGGVSHTLKAVVSSYHPEDAQIVMRVTSAGNTIAEKTFTVNTKSRTEWKRISLDFTVPADTTAEVSIGVKGRSMAAIGAVSLLPADHFRGMRADVIDYLREIGTSVVRWPGGNFAGEYRWRDGLIEDPDERTPLQSYTEIETQPHSLGYDSNDIGMEDILALCERIGAQPCFTINAAWESPKDSADWVKHCKGRVKMWSLGNEMGYGHMEGPKNPKGYTDMVRPHAEEMLKVDPSLTIIASGPYPHGGQGWINDSAKALFPVAPIISYHRYDSWICFDFSSPERTEKLYKTISGHADQAFNTIRSFRSRLPKEIGISYDEWNIWYMWYRQEGIVEGLYAAKMLNNFMRNWEELGIKLVCYFQAINEQAITVSPYESHLTSIGEAMRLWKEHVGGVPVTDKTIPTETFVTDAPDGTRYATFYNFSTREPLTIRIPTGGRNTIAAEKTLIPNGFVTSCRYKHHPGRGKINDDFYEVVLPPAAQSSVRLKR
jgi:alpha-N-arabinofuranosidase